MTIIPANILFGLIRLVGALLIVFLVLKSIAEIWKRTKGKDTLVYNEDDEIPYGISGRYFGSAFFGKLIFQLISVKVWGLVAGTAISTYLATHSIETTTVLDPQYGTTGTVKSPIISGAQWTAFNTTIWALIYGMKEVYRVADMRLKGDTQQALEVKKAETEEKIKLTQEKARAESIVLSQIAQQPLTGRGTGRPRVDSEGHEIVGEDSEAA
jgi:hypothetical protein